MPIIFSYSSMFVFGAGFLALIIAWHIFRTWQKLALKANSAIEKHSRAPSPLGAIIQTVVLLGAFILLATMGWNVIVQPTNNSSDLKNPPEVRDQNKILEPEFPKRRHLKKTSASPEARKTQWSQ